MKDEKFQNNNAGDERYFSTSDYSQNNDAGWTWIMSAAAMISSLEVIIWMTGKQMIGPNAVHMNPGLRYLKKAEKRSV